MKKNVLRGLFASFKVVKSHQCLKGVLVTKFCLRKKKPKKPPKTKNLDKKNMKSNIFGIPWSSCLKISKKREFLKSFFRVFLTKESLIFSAFKQKILDEIKQSNGIKPPKNLFFKIFCKFLPHKGYVCWNVSSKIIYTFYTFYTLYLLTDT